jgi:dipeptidyl aminopeptidase/acylaminoacyl peptidase
MRSRLLIALGCLVIAASARAQKPSSHTSYASALNEANSVHAYSSISLNDDGRWVAVATKDSILVFQSKGGAFARVPFVKGNVCRAPAWEPRGNRLAVICHSAILPGHVPASTKLYTWRPGSPEMQLIDSAIVDRVGLDSPFRWMSEGKRIVYAVRDAAPRMIAGSSASGRTVTSVKATADKYRCLPPEFSYPMQADPVLCSDSADVMRSKFLQTVMTAPDSRSVLARGSDVTDPEIVRLVDSTFYKIVVADVDRNTRTVAARLRGADLEITGASHGRVGVLMRDSVTSGYWTTAYSVSTHGNVPSQPVARETIIGLFTARAYAWAPDVSAVAWRQGDHNDTTSVDTLRINSADAKSSATYVLSRAANAANGKSWKPTGLNFFGAGPVIKWTPDADSVLVSVNGNLWLLPRSGVSKKLLSTRADPMVSGIALVTNSRALVTASDPSTGRPSFWWVTFADGHWRHAAEFEQSWEDRSMTAVNAGTPTVAYVATTRESPNNVYVVQLTGRDGVRAKTQQLTHVTLAHALPAVRDTLITYETAFGTATALLIRPASATAALPAVFYGYPGDGRPADGAYKMKPTSDVFDAFSVVERGYVFAYVQVPMTPVPLYGKNGPAAAIVDDFTAARTAIARTGWIDTTRLGVVGHSYGGYMVNVLLTFAPKLFQAGVSMSGSSDIISNLHSGWGASYYIEGQGRMGATLNENPDRYLANSPVRHLDQLTAPLLLLHGAQDPTVTIDQAEEMFRGLSRLGKPVELVRYTKGDHSPEDAWWQRTLDWFDLWLKPTH